MPRPRQAYRDWVRTLFTTLAHKAGVADPDALARQLHLLYVGAGLSARMDHDSSAATTARAAAAAPAPPTPWSPPGAPSSSGTPWQRTGAAPVTPR
ncbi:MAG TPA: hypothetical protein VHO07_30365 [Streptosporangiaceae bacterium]|nr:hypothetical protein [Streptosporangiaceae bacterium]